MTESSAREQLEEIERDRLSVYVARGSLPSWYWPFLGTSTGLMMASHDLANRIVTVSVTVLYAAIVGAVWGKVLAEARVLVRIRTMPASLSRPLVVYMLVTIAVVFGGMITSTMLAGVPWSYTQLGIGSGLVMWLGGWQTSRVYNARADRMALERGIRR